MTHLRNTGWIEPTRYGRTFATRAPVPEVGLDQLPNHVRNPLPAEVLNQGPIGSCVAEACAFGCEALAPKSLTAPERPSRRWLYYEARRAIGTVGEDSGSIAGDALAVLRRGWVPERAYGHNHDWATWVTPPPAPRDDAAFLLNSEALPHDVGTVLFELAQGNLVVGGFRIDDGWDAPDSVLPDPDGPVTGGHCVLLAGYQRDADGVHFRVRNSWGESWGDGGEIWMPASWLSIARCGELHALRVVRNPTAR